MPDVDAPIELDFVHSKGTHTGHGCVLFRKDGDGENVALRAGLCPDRSTSVSIEAQCNTEMRGRYTSPFKSRRKLQLTTRKFSFAARPVILPAALHVTIASRASVSTDSPAESYLSTEANEKKHHRRWGWKGEDVPTVLHAQ